VSWGSPPILDRALEDPAKDVHASDEYASTTLAISSGIDALAGIAVGASAAGAMWRRRAVHPVSPFARAART
jgi:hypothetical protein